MQANTYKDDLAEIEDPFKMQFEKTIDEVSSLIEVPMKLIWLR